MVKLLVGGSLDIASCLLAGFPPHFLVSEGDLAVVLPDTPFVWVFFFFCVTGRVIHIVLLLHMFLEMLR